VPDKPGLRTYSGAVAVITGGASGIGRALAEALAQRGAEVVLADRQIELAEQMAAKMRAAGGNATAMDLDVTDFAAVDRLVQQVRESRGRLDYFFNNAGIGIGGEVREYSIDDWNRVFAVNLHGVANGVQAAYPVMLRQGFGHIVNTASMAGLMPSPWTVSYAATKHAVVGLTTSLRIEAAPAGVRLSVMCPGVIRTPILEGGKFGKMLPSLEPAIREQRWERFRPMEPSLFARKALRAIARNEAIIVIPAWWKLIWWLNRFSPSLGLAFGHKLHQYTQKQVELARKKAASGPAH
jgi:NAD(P)-dependent dehydrogenase (short-subunit alcohol dehydrogenase family)